MSEIEFPVDKRDRAIDLAVEAAPPVASRHAFSGAVRWLMLLQGVPASIGLNELDNLMLARGWMIGKRDRSKFYVSPAMLKED